MLHLLALYYTNMFSQASHAMALLASVMLFANLVVAVPVDDPLAHASSHASSPLGVIAKGKPAAQRWSLPALHPVPVEVKNYVTVDERAADARTSRPLASTELDKRGEALPFSVTVRSLEGGDDVDNQVKSTDVKYMKEKRRRSILAGNIQSVASLAPNAGPSPPSPINGTGANAGHVK